MHTGVQVWVVATAPGEERVFPCWEADAACAQGFLQMESPAPPACASVWPEQLGPSRAKLATSKSISRHHKTSSFLALCRCSVPAWQRVWVTQHRGCSHSSSPPCVDTVPATGLVHPTSHRVEEEESWRHHPIVLMLSRMSLPGASTLMDNTCGCAHSTCRDGSSLFGKCCCDKAAPHHSLLLNICSSTGSVLLSNPTILNVGLAIERKHRSRVCAQVQHLKIQSLVVLISRETLFISSVKL